MTSEQAARQTIDELLSAAGWAVQDSAARVQRTPERTFGLTGAKQVADHQIGPGPAPWDREDLSSGVATRHGFA
jgi:hypothetical protein